MFSVSVLTRDKLKPCRDTRELSAELNTLKESVRKDTAPTKKEKKYFYRSSMFGEVKKTKGQTNIICAFKP